MARKRVAGTKRGKPGVAQRSGETAHTKEDVLRAVGETFGTIYLAASRLGVTGDTVTNYAKRWPEVAAAIVHERGKQVDTAEVVMFRALTCDDPSMAMAAAKFILERLGKDRGYSEKHQLELTGRAEVTEVVVRTREEAKAIISAMGKAT